VGCLSVCKAHARHDAKFVTQDLAAAVRRIARTGDPAEVLKKLATYAQQQRMPLELAEMMMYTAHVLATHKDRDHIELWSRRIAEATLPESERTLELAFADPEEVEEERANALQQEAAAAKSQTLRASDPQPSAPADAAHQSIGLPVTSSPQSQN
jgi:hypothetical protein